MSPLNEILIDDIVFSLSVAVAFSGFFLFAGF